MFAIVDIAGFQEKVSEGDTLQVPLQDGKAGDKLVFGNVHLISKDGDITFGSPFIKGASVEAKLVEHGRGEKIRVFHMRRRKRMRKVQGHRQDHSMIEITKVVTAS